MNGRYKMSRYIASGGVFAVIMLVCGGCGPEPEPTAPPQPAMQIEPAEVNVVFEPKPLEPEQKTVQEPNMRAATPPEPNVQEPVEIKPSPALPAESNLAEPNETPQVKTSVVELQSKCSQVLSKYVDSEGYVDYRTLSRRKMELLDVLDSFKKLDREDYSSWPREDKMAFWINAYNVEFIGIILDNYPIESTRVLRLFWPPNSIRHIKGIWDKHKFIIMDEEFTLQEIERRFFKREFDEPRVFFAIYYGSLSGPPLRNEVYHGEDLSAQLDDQVKRFLAGNQAFKIERGNQTVYLSSILNTTWHGQRFIGKYGTDLKFKQQEPAMRAVLNFLTRYISKADVNYLETANYKVEFLRYDWTLNERGG
jgi:hypothetical protein